MTVHGEHPFVEPEPLRDPVRRFRGRLGGVVSLWTTGQGPDRTGLTVSSLLVAPGEPPRVLGLLDPDSELADALGEADVPAVVQLLSWSHRDLADAFAGTAPAPGGPFRRGQWEQTAWGPRLSDTVAWAGVRFDGSAGPVGWSVLLQGVVEHVEIAPDPPVEHPGTAPLVHRRGRYLRPDGSR